MTLQFQLMVPAPSGAPFAALGVACDDEKIYAIHYLPTERQVVGPQNQWQCDLENRLRAYFEDPKSARFDDLLPRLCASSVLPSGMLEVVRGIPCGEVCRYGIIARKIGWGDKFGGRRVGTACGKNLVGIVVPCYRAVSEGSRHGTLRLGGYSKGNPCVDEKTGLKIKRWLIEHEGGWKVLEHADRSVPMSDWELRLASIGD